MVVIIVNDKKDLTLIGLMCQRSVQWDRIMSSMILEGSSHAVLMCFEETSGLYQRSRLLCDCHFSNTPITKQEVYCCGNWSPLQFLSLQTCMWKSWRNSVQSEQCKSNEHMSTYHKVNQAVSGMIPHSQTWILIPEIGKLSFCFFALVSHVPSHAAKSINEIKVWCKMKALH